MYVQVVTFKLNGITEEQYRSACEADTPIFAALPGLLSKVWLRDPETGTYGGLYLWRDRESYENYLASDVFAAIRDDPTFRGVHSQGFDHFEMLTKATQPGLVVA